MKKSFFIVPLLLSLTLLTACGGSQAQPAIADQSTETPLPPAEPTASSTQCTVQSQQIADDALPDDHITGELEDYAITIVVYSDFTCEVCATIAAALETAVEIYPEDIRLIYRHYTSTVRKSLAAAQAAQAAGMQGKFQEMYLAFYEDFEPWVELDDLSFNDFLWEQVSDLDLDTDQFMNDIRSQEVSATVDEQYLQGVYYLELLQENEYAADIAAAAESAGRQNQFWEMYQLILGTQETWQALDRQSLNSYLIEQAIALELDPDQYADDLAFLSGPGNETDPLQNAVNYFSLFYRTPKGLVAAKAAEAAGRQGKFWEMHDVLFDSQSEWVDLEEQGILGFITDQLEGLDLDSEQFFDDYYSQDVEELIIEDYLEIRDPYNPPPRVFVNGDPTPPFISTVDDFLLWIDNLMIPYWRHIRTQQFSECPPMTIDLDGEYTATLQTGKGDIVIALYPEAAPFAVNSFIFLAEQNYYDNTPFYAVIEDYVAQAGDPSGTGWGTPGYLYDIEISALNFDRPYMVAMTNSGPGSNNSQFFITFNSLSYMNGQNTIFGEVIDGIEVLNKLSLRDPESNPFAPHEDFILDVTITKQ